ISGDRESHGALVLVEHVNSPNYDGGTNSHQVRSRDKNAFGYRLKVVHFEFDGRKPPRAAKPMIEGDADRRVGHTGRDATVQHAGSVHQVGTEAALDSNAVAMSTDQFNTEQVVECALPQERFRLSFIRCFFRTQVLVILS